MTCEWKSPQDYFRVWVKTQWKSAESETENRICSCAFCITVNLIWTVVLGNASALAALIPATE